MSVFVYLYLINSYAHAHSPCASLSANNKTLNPTIIATTNSYNHDNTAISNQCTKITTKRSNLHSIFIQWAPFFTILFVNI